jgi:glycerate kinase
MVSVLIAPDKFKGSLSADDVGLALERGLLDGAPHARVRRLALADGGEGSVAAACSGRFSPETITVTGPTGQPLTARVAVDGRTVIIEAAAVCGLGVLPGGHKAPLTATSSGLGQAVQYALAGEADTIVLALGGVATTDGGAGLLQSLGAVLAREDGTPVGPGGRELAGLHTVDLTEARAALAGVDLLLATDVDNPLLGPTGTAPRRGRPRATYANSTTPSPCSYGGWRPRASRTRPASPGHRGPGRPAGSGMRGCCWAGGCARGPTTSSPCSEPTPC